MKNQWEHDSKNDRMVAYLPNNNHRDIENVVEDFDKGSLGKLIIYTKIENKQVCQDLGCRLEGEMTGFFLGEKAIIYTKYNDSKRNLSVSKEENKSVLSIVQDDRKDISNFSSDYQVELVCERDMENLAALYKLVFPVYPTNIFDADYLRKAREENYLFMVAKNKQGRLMGAASAMDSGYGSAEITDCAVHPDYRGNQVLHGIILGLEEELVKRGINHAYSITRAKSVGMNMTVKRLGYSYEGTLTNNCIISTGFEDMNLWTKKLI